MSDIDREYRDFCVEEDEMNKQHLKHCERCHSAFKGDKYIFEPSRPIVTYTDPKLCNICKDPQYSQGATSKKGLPSIEEGLLCQCKYPGCEKKFVNRPSWYLKQQHVVKALGNPWMPVLIDPDKNKVEALLTNGESEPCDNEEEPCNK